MFIRNVFIIIVFCYLILSHNLFSQIVLEGTVTDNGAQFLGSGAEPVVNALVKVINQSDTNRSFSTYTNAQGQYEIQIIDTEVDAIHSEIPGEFHLYQNYPNPFNPSTVIAFELSGPGVIRLEIYNILGQRIKTLFDGLQISRTGRIVWDGTDDLGQSVPAGVYICSLNGEGTRINRKMLLIDGHQSISNAIMSQPAGTHGFNQNVKKHLSDQYLLRVTGDDIELYEVSLEITSSKVIDITVIRTVTDIDGNIYRTVKIGDQWWMAENLEVTHYRNGDPIPNVTDSVEWTGLSAGAYCAYDNDENHVATYGCLYNWYAVDDSRDIAPEGWHVPRDSEWQVLEDYLGGMLGAGGKLKSDTDLWNHPNTGGTNETGFTALPAGYRWDSDGWFYGIKAYASFWSSTEHNSVLAFERDIIHDDAILFSEALHKRTGSSVRCVRGPVIPVTGIEITPANSTLYNGSSCEFTCTATYSDSSTRDVTAFTTWEVTPGVAGEIDENGLFTADAVNTGIEIVLGHYGGFTDSASVNVIPVDEETVTDIDGNVYRTVKIGDQVWMAENLKTVHYRNGDPVPNVKGNADWSWPRLTYGAYCNYDNNSDTAEVYGHLYNWYAVNDSRGIAPYGWHVANDTEWQILIEDLGGNTVAGGKLKEVGTAHWASPNTGATNESGFTALPAGLRLWIDGSFSQMSHGAYFWSSTDYNLEHELFIFEMDYDKEGILRYDDGYRSGYSVRCVRGSEPLNLTGLEITPSSDTLTNGETLQFTCTATYSDLSTRDVTAFTNWEVAPGTAGDIDPNGLFTADATNTGVEIVRGSYCWYGGEMPYGSYHVEMMDSATVTVLSGGKETVTDIDGNVYNIVQIGDQVWMAENLKVTHYRNGDPIPNVTGDAAWAGLISGAYCNYDNDENNAATYGHLYNWYAVDDGRNIAPDGWHMPSDTEWHSLEYCLGGSDIAGGKMKEAGDEHWASPNTGATNESGFSALPGAFRFHDGSYYSIGNYADFWSSTEYNEQSALYRDLSYDNSGVYCNNYNKHYGFAVRCVKNSGARVTLTGVEITPADVSLSNGETRQFTCTATYSDQSTRDVTAFTTWEVTPGIAGSINPDGLFTTHGWGVETVRGHYFGKMGSATVTVHTETITDIDGNVYHIVTIGDQVWMAENLKVTHYRNGESIPNVTDNAAWGGLTTGAYCDYDNDPGHVLTYGHLYNWFTVNDSRHIAPTGWHVPTDAEFQSLQDYLGVPNLPGGNEASGKLKETGTTHWSSPNEGATNESGFTALPGGYRLDGSFYDLGNNAHFWSSSESTGDWALGLVLFYNDSGSHRTEYRKRVGFSVRCLKD